VSLPPWWPAKISSSVTGMLALSAAPEGAVLAWSFITVPVIGTSLQSSSAARPENTIGPA
jgi:hypothetical protein